MCAAIFCRVRDFIYIDDIIEAYLIASQFNKITPGAIYNLGTGIEHTNDEIVKIIYYIWLLYYKYIY